MIQSTVFGKAQYADTTLICLTPGQVAVPQKMISTRKGGNWDNPSTWLANRAPIDGDTVIINDSARVNVLSGTAIRIPLLNVGRGITSHASALVCNSTSFVITEKLTVSRPQDLLNGKYTVEKDFTYNSTANVSDATNMDLTISGTGNKQFTRNVADSSFAFINTVLNCPACTVTVSYPYRVTGSIALNNGVFNAQKGVSYNTSCCYNSNNKMFRTNNGFYLGPPVKVANNSYLLTYNGQGMADTMRAGNEWPNTPQYFDELSFSGVKNFIAPHNTRILSKLSLSHTFVTWPTDTLDVDTYYDFLGIVFPTTLSYISGAYYNSVNTKVVRNQNGGFVALGVPGRFSNLVISPFKRGVTSLSPKMEISLVGQPNQNTGGLLPPLTQLRGSNIIRIKKVAGLHDSLNLTLYNNTSDSLNFPKLQVRIAQAVSPNGPWKAVSKPDSSGGNSQYRTARVAVADGEYFSWARAQPSEKLATLKKVFWPADYTTGCPTSLFVPIRYVINNTGTLPLDSIEVGMNTGAEYKVRKVAIIPPLRPYGVDTILVDGPDGLNLTLASPSVKAWIGFPAKGIKADTVTTKFNSLPSGLPWFEGFDTITYGTLFNHTVNFTPLIKGWEFNYFGGKLSLPNSTYYYDITGNPDRFLYARRALFDFRIASRPIAVASGKHVFTYRAKLNSSGFALVDTIYFEYTQDCGQTWQLIEKRLSNTLPYPNASVFSDTFNIATGGNIAIRHRYYRSSTNSSIPTYDYFKLEAVSTALANAVNNSTLQWYPNPTTGLVNCNLELEAQVFNQLGSLVVRQKVDSDHPLNLKSLPRGIYTIVANGIRSLVVKE